MTSKALAHAMTGPRITTTASTGLWGAMVQRVRPCEPISTVELAQLAPKGSMFDYDPDQAVAVTEDLSFF